MYEELDHLRGKMPEYVIKTLPLILSKETIRNIGGIDAEVVQEILEASIEEINEGSKEDLDTLFRRRLSAIK